jgi:hypothetical protein
MTSLLGTHLKARPSNTQQATEAIAVDKFETCSLSREHSLSNILRCHFTMGHIKIAARIE